MGPYYITEAREEHLPALGDIERAAAALFPSGSIPEHVRLETLPLRFLREGISDGTLWVALLGQCPVGYALLRQTGGIALLAQIDVHPGHGRRGLGTALVRYAVEKAATLGHQAMYLTTFAHIPWNAPFYAKLGFVAQPVSEAPPVMRSIIEDELAAGLKHRVIMRLGLQSHDQSA